MGDVGIGGANPIRVQSMTTTDTRDTRATVDQAERLASAGCEIVRVTAPSLRDAENLREIAAELRRRGVRVPLVADIHYTPNAALEAARHVEKVRVNPGNYADKKKFLVREYSDAEYAREIERVAERFRPLVRRCRELGRALRIGTNHGSLADRIMNRYGDTPRGMVESALEFLDVCEAEAYTDVVFSMKASNPRVAIEAYRLLADRLEERAPGVPGYPFHVGVTEAGEGEDGRIKSAIGIGALLEDGIGDTVRVSLTEDPVKEIPAAATLARRCARPAGPPPVAASRAGAPRAAARRVTRGLGPPGFEVGGDHPVRVELELGPVPTDPKQEAAGLAASLGALREVACEGLLVDVMDPPGSQLVAPFAAALREAGLVLPVSVRVEAPFAPPCAEAAARLVVPVGDLVGDDALSASARRAAETGTPLEWSLRGDLARVPALLDRALAASRRAGLDALLVSTDAELPVHAARAAAGLLRGFGGADVPIVLRQRRDPAHDDEEALLAAAVHLGVPLCDGIGDAVALDAGADAARAVELGYRILQGARLRTSWTEYISCPSCGRTLFDLEETTARIRARTQHLRGVKIAVMGCIVNGPGEMADADFGYVGSGPGLVDLYVGKELVERKLPDGDADERLVDLIRRHGRWRDP